LHPNAQIQHQPRRHGTDDAATRGTRRERRRPPQYRLRLTRKGKALYQKLIPRLLGKEQEILSCLSAQERRDFARMLGKIEKSLDLVQTSEEANKTGAY
jgi:hypothetical protein